MARLGEPDRQRRFLDQLQKRVAVLPWVDVVIVIGSMASGLGDAVSDVDLLVGIHDGAFAEAWRNRSRLRVTGSVHSWDHWLDESKGAGTHKWLSGDVILIEALIGVPTSGIRLASPWRVLAGDPRSAHRWPPRPPISRIELRSDLDALHPVEAAYDSFKAGLRAAKDQGHDDR